MRKTRREEAQGFTTTYTSSKERPRGKPLQFPKSKPIAIVPLKAR